jgi:hypothetical protein
MQEQSLGTISKGENVIITLEDMEEKGSTVRKGWHDTMYRHTRIRGS